MTQNDLKEKIAYADERWVLERFKKKPKSFFLKDADLVDWSLSACKRLVDKGELEAKSVEEDGKSFTVFFK